MPIDDRRWIPILFWLGLVVAVGMVARSQVAGDQLNLLGVGWELVYEGNWLPHGVPTSGGGFVPGGFTALVTGLPLLIWRDHRASAALTLLTHIAAYLLLDRLLRRLLGPEERFLFAVLYWLNPWRIYHSAFTWNPNYIFLVGAVHLWTAWRLRERPRLWPSFVHVAALGLAMQLAVTTLPLVVASLLLWWRRYLRLHLGGALAAGALVAASLVPWARAAAADPSLLPGSGDGTFFYLLNTSVRAVIYWIRYASLALSTELYCLDFAPLVGERATGVLGPALEVVKPILYLTTLPVAVWANYRLFRSRWSWWRRPSTPADGARTWLEGVTRWSLVAVFVTFAVSPATVSRWYVFALFHVAVLPLVLAGADWLRGPRARPAARAVCAYTAASGLLVVALLAAGPVYRCGGERCSAAVRIPDLRHDHPMLEALGIQDTCEVRVDVPGGWWPRAVPEPRAAGSARAPSEPRAGPPSL